MRVIVFKINHSIILISETTNEVRCIFLNKLINYQLDPLRLNFIGFRNVATKRRNETHAILTVFFYIPKIFLLSKHRLYE